MRAVAATALVAAAALAGCGGGGSGTQTAPTQPATTAPASTTTPATTPTATTNTPPTHHRTKPQPSHGSSSAPLRVTANYTCKGRPLRAIAADGPVKVDPAIVRPGQQFTVTVTDPSARVALVSLAGVAPKPIQANARASGATLAATLTMPGYATCGNKLLEVEGDVSAEAYVGVSR